jgi:hypothetical protein
VRPDKAYVALKGGCLYVYLDGRWPPELPPVVRVCHRRVSQLFGFFMEYGAKHMEAGVVELPKQCVYAAAALALITYAADLDKRSAYELCDETPEAVKALIADAVRWSAHEDGPAIDPKYYRKLAVALREIVEAWQESKKAPTLDSYT